MSRPEGTEGPKISLEVVPSKCAEHCLEHSLPPGEQFRPLLVKVTMNNAARTKCAERTGVVPEDQYVCVNHRCGALMQFLKTLAPLQELVKP